MSGDPRLTEGDLLTVAQVLGPVPVSRSALDQLAAERRTGHWGPRL